MFGGGSITLFHIRGIRIAVDWSWFLILFQFIQAGMGTLDPMKKFPWFLRLNV